MNDLTLVSSQSVSSTPDLLQSLQAIEAQVRQAPAAAEHRWALVEILCQLARWERALQQLQAWARLRPERHAQAHLVRGLIQAEMQRTRVFAGAERAAPVVDMPEWMQDLAQALALNAAGQEAQADASRSKALERAPNFVGTCAWDERTRMHSAGERNARAVAWLADSDTRLGPVCEVIVAGAYRWLAFADLAHLQVQAPQTALDLVWLPAQLQLRRHTAPQNNPLIHVFLPARSCWLEPPVSPSDAQQALMLGQLTEWNEVGQTGVFSLGQKTWMTADGDLPLFDLREVRA